MVTPWYGRDEGGGVAVAVENLLQSLRQRGVPALAVIIVGDGWLPRIRRGSEREWLIYLPVRPRPRGSDLRARGGYWSRLPLTWMIVASLLLARSIRIVHFHYPSE